MDAANSSAPSKKVGFDDGTSLQVKAVQNPTADPDKPSVSQPVNKLVSKTPCPDPTKPEWDCSTSTEQFTATSSSFLNSDYSNVVNKLYPGAMYTFNNFYSGAYKETDGPRNPITVGTLNTNVKDPTKNALPVNNPNRSTIGSVVDQLVGNLTNENGNQELVGQTYSSTNSSEMNLKISGGASAYGFSFSDSFGATDQSESVCVTMDFRKTLYSLYAEPVDPNNLSYTYFQNSAQENTPNMMMISNVNYGMRILANVTYTFKNTTDANNFKASFSSLSVQANVALDYFTRNTSSVTNCNIYVVGGPGNQGKMKLSPAQLQNTVTGLLNQASYKNSVPISFQFTDLAGNVIGTESATDTFQVRECRPNGNPLKISRVRVEFLTGNDDKDYDTRLGVYLYKGIYNVQGNERTNAVMGHEDIEGNTRQDTYNQKFDNNSDHFVILDRNGPGMDRSQLDANSFLKGGTIRVHIVPNGHDHWVIQTMNLIFDMEDGSQQTCTFRRFELSGNSYANFYFHPNGQTTFQQDTAN